MQRAVDEARLGRSRGGDNKTHVWAKPEVADTTRDVLPMRVVKMSVEDLFGKRQRTIQPAVALEVRTGQGTGTHLERTISRLSWIRW